jgi:hypothetical protein
MFKSKKTFLYVLLLTTFAFTACNSEDPEAENDQEVITDVILSFQELNLSGIPTGAIITFKASDPQGIEVGSTPTIDNVTLIKGKTYQMKIEVRNSIANEDITAEILAESDEHQFYFLGTAFVGSSVLTYTYADPSGELIGLEGKVVIAQSPGFNNANMRIVLRHDLDKNFPGALNPNFENFIQAGGETDLDITFPLILN